MPKRAAALDLTLPPPAEPDRSAAAGFSPAGGSPTQPAYRWLYSSLRTEILEGRLRPGARLPASRELARQYGFARGTIVAAFEQLAAEGYVEGTVGSGTYVSRVLPEQRLHVGRDSLPRAAPIQRQHRRFSARAKRVTPLLGFEAGTVRAFRANLPALNLFPTALWAQVTARRLRRASMGLLLECETMGYLPLRRAIADYLGMSRGVKCLPEQVAIVSGMQEALDLSVRVLIDPGAPVCMEDPGYPGARLVFEAAGARIAAVGVDSEGMRLPEPRGRSPRLVYLTPGHQSPTGVTMSLSRRLQLLQWARRSGALLFEDDYDSEYRYSGRPVPALQGLDRAGVVLFAGSFSKVLFPSLRLGYLVVPSDLVERFAAAKSVATRHAPLLDQAVLCDFVSEGHLDRHLRRMREVYAERLSILLSCAKERLAGLLELSPVEAGLQTVGWLNRSIEGEAVARAAAARGVEVKPLSRYSRRPLPRDGLQLGFAAIDEVEIRRGVAELAMTLEEEARRPGRRPS
jgi:GntR family transcriptional regulator / MocR family aminotransferase